MQPQNLGFYLFMKISATSTYVKRIMIVQEIQGLQQESQEYYIKGIM